MLSLHKEFSKPVRSRCWRKLFSLVFFSFVVLFNSVSAHAEMYIHQMKHLQASQVVDVIKPHLAPETVITAKDYKLFIEATPAEYQKIQSMLQMLDKKPGEYLVEVRILNRRLADNELTQVKVRVNNSNPQASVKNYQSSQGNRGEKNFSVRAVEGYQAYINTGEIFPTHQVRVDRDYGAFLPETTYQSTHSGLYVTINGTPDNKVRVALSAQSEQRKQKYGDTIQQSSTENYVTGVKNRWLLIAATGEATNKQQSRSYSANSSRSNKQWYYLRVTDIIR